MTSSYIAMIFKNQPQIKLNQKKSPSSKSGKFKPLFDEREEILLPQLKFQSLLGKSDMDSIGDQMTTLDSATVNLSMHTCKSDPLTTNTALHFTKFRRFPQISHRSSTFWLCAFGISD